MALWKCSNCDFTKDSRCKPKKCPECEGTTFEKDDSDWESKKAKCCGCATK